MVILSWSADWFTADKAGRKKKSNASELLKQRRAEAKLQQLHTQCPSELVWYRQYRVFLSSREGGISVG